MKSNELDKSLANQFKAKKENREKQHKCLTIQMKMEK